MALSADFIRIYQQVIEIINNLFDTHGSFILELDAGGKQLKTLAHSCQHKYDQDLNGTFTTLPEGILSTSNLEGGVPLYLTKDQLHTISGPMGAHLQDIKIQNIALMPLVLREKVYGYLGLELHEEGCPLTSEAADLLRVFSTDIAQLMENERAYEQSKALIADQERNRLARDLHDSVTQMLFSVTLLAEVLPQIWRRNPEQGLQRLEKLRRLTHGALAEMRTLLLELRPSAVINTPLGDLLAQLTEAVASRSGLPFELFIEQTPSLPEKVQTTFYRIAQEALNNVVKHAQARKVTVSLSDTPLPHDLNGVAGHEIRLVIQDDGVGYYTGVLRSDCMGISIMHERAAAIHADLSLESQPGHGTQVTLIWSSANGSLE
jgi:signal transduction histidine kinase